MSAIYLFPSALAELEEEHSGEDAAFGGFDRINAAAVKDRINEIGTDPDGAAELKVLKEWVKLTNDEAALKKVIKELDAKLDQLAHDQYAKLTVEEIQRLVVNDKWLTHLAADLQAELGRVGQTLTRRIRELAERYAVPLPTQMDEVASLSAKVDGHLKRLGVVWN